MDFQNGIVERLGSPEVLHAATRAIDVARQRGVPVVFVRVAFRAGLPEVAATNKSFSTIRAAGGSGMDADAESTALHAALGARPGDLVVVKRRVSAFAGSDLAVLLRGLDVRHLVLAGIATSGVVLFTLREAADQDYVLTVLADACADGDPEVHRVLTEKVFLRQAAVTTVDDWAAALG